LQKFASFPAQPEQHLLSFEFFTLGLISAAFLDPPYFGLLSLTSGDASVPHSSPLRPGLHHPDTLDDIVSVFPEF
jgi:hypothetical protein